MNKTSNKILLSFITLPIIWIFGLEQFYIYIFLVFGVIFVIKKSSIKIHAEHLVLFLALTFMLFSSTGIEENYRYITYIRTILIYISLFFLLIISANIKIDSEKFERHIVLYLYSITIIGIIGILDVWRPEFKSAVGYILPDRIISTTIGEYVAFKSLGRVDWFAIVGSYFRVTSIYLYPTLFASSIVFLIPVVLSTQYYRNISWIHKTLLSSIVIINLLFTTARVPIISLISSYIIALTLYKITVSLKSLILVTILLSTILTPIIYNVAQFTGDTSSILDELLFARGSGSVYSRGDVYIESIKAFLVKPFLGWGTERHSVETTLSLGSHSYYISILFRYGLLGFITMSLTYILLIRKVLIRYHSSEIIHRLAFVFIFLTVSITESVDIDSITILTLWLGIIYFIYTKRTK